MADGADGGAVGGAGTWREDLGAGREVRGMLLRRLHTVEGCDPLDAITWVPRRASIKDEEGGSTFTKEVEAPDFWSQSAVDIVSAKYLRRRGVAKYGGSETSVRHPIERIARTIGAEARRQGLFGSPESPEAARGEAILRDELAWLMVHQRASFNSPVWFNVGLFQQYGIEGGATNYFWSDATDRVEACRNGYEHPQSSACYIQKAGDSLAEIFQLLAQEAAVFRHGSGTGTNFSALRGRQEKLSGGGTSSGLMSFLEVFDRAAGSTKSGGTCLAPRQRVYTELGPVAVQDLAALPGGEFIALSYDPPAGRYKAKRARAWLAGHKRVVRVTTDKGVFEVTDDHPVKLSSGEACLAERLTPGMSLLACSIKSNRGYVEVSLRDGRKGRELLHRLVAADVMGADIEGLSVHHKDENPLNNHPSNLRVMQQSEHAREHNLDRVEEGVHIFQTERFPKAGEANGMHTESPFYADAARHEPYRALQATILAQSGRAPVMQDYAAEQKMLNLAFRVLNAGCAIDTFEQYAAGRAKVVGRIGSLTKLRGQINARFGSHEAFVAAVSAQNHRVVSVESVGDMDVYDVEVLCPTPDDKSPASGHNFVIWPDGGHFGSGVVVFNTRRAAKMVCLDMDHPEILDFVRWKRREEGKMLALKAAGYGKGGLNSEAVRTVSGQNSNNSVRVSDAFLRAVAEDGEWRTTARTTGEVIETFQARMLWDEVNQSAWACADPGVQFDDATNAWHTCKASGRINASNPCAEFVFLDGTSCNLASINLGRYESEGGEDGFDVEAYLHAARTLFIAQEVLVDFASYPTAEIAQNSHDFRPLGLGYANMGSYLMRQGYGYDSPEGRDRAAVLTALLTAEAYLTSADLAEVRGAFPRFEENRASMIEVMGMHADAATALEWRCVYGPSSRLAKRAMALWCRVVERGREVGYRNAQATLSAPTGTISFAMDCDTTGIEPDFALVNWKSLVGGGFMKQINRSVGPALARLGYAPPEIEAIVRYVVGTGQIGDEVRLGAGTFGELFADEERARIRARIQGVSTLDGAFAPATLGPDALDRLGLRGAVAPGGGWAPGFSPLRELGMEPEAIRGLEEVVLGHGTIEGAPFLRDEHLPVFDCANRCGKGVRFLSPEAHVKMVAAVQPFLSGSVSKTVNVPADATVDDIRRIHEFAHAEGLKCIAVYRDGCKGEQPLTTSGSGAAPAPAQASVAARAAALEAALGSVVAHTEPAALGGLLADPAGALGRLNGLARAALGQPQRAPGEYEGLLSTLRQARPRAAGFAVRERLPSRRRGPTIEARIDGHKVFVRFGEYPDGRLGEVFIDMAGEGSALRGWSSAFAVAVSVGLQHGVPAEAYVKSLHAWRFEPAGLVQGHERIRLATSVVSYVVAAMGVDYCGRDDLAQLPAAPRESGDVALSAAQALAEQRVEDGALRSSQVPDFVHSTVEALRVAPPSDRASGDFCSHCGNMMRQSGTCRTCPACGATSGGCS